MTLTACWNATTRGIFLSWQRIITLCGRKKTICLQVLVKTFREPLIKVFREPWMATYSREDFRLASSERLISLGVCRHSLKLCRPLFLYLSKCCAFKKCKMIVPKSAIGLKPHAVASQLYLLPSTCITCHFKLWIVEDLTVSIAGKSLPVCGWDCVRWVVSPGLHWLPEFFSTPAKFSKIKCLWQMGVCRSSRLAEIIKIADNTADKTVCPENLFPLWAAEWFYLRREGDFYFFFGSRWFGWVFFYLQSSFQHYRHSFYITQRNADSLSLKSEIINAFKVSSLFPGPYGSCDCFTQMTAFSTQT